MGMATIRPGKVMDDWLSGNALRFPASCQCLGREALTAGMVIWASDGNGIGGKIMPVGHHKLH